MRSRYAILKSLILVGILLSILFGANIQPARADITMKVRVTDCSTGQAIPGAALTVTTGRQNNPQAAYTNDQGIATLTPVRPGYIVHTFVVRAEGYVKYTWSEYLDPGATYREFCMTPYDYRKITDTPVPSPPTLIPTLTSTPHLDDLSVLRCQTYIFDNIKGLILPDDLVILASALTSCASCTIDCYNSTGRIFVLASTCFQQCPSIINTNIIYTVAKLIIKQGSLPGKIIVALWNLFGDITGLRACGDVGIFVWELVRSLARNGVKISALGIHSPARVYITDQYGRRAGILEDGRLVEEISEAKVAISGEDVFLLYPANPNVKVTIKGIRTGKMTLESINTKDTTVQEISFIDVDITENTTGEMDLSSTHPAIRIGMQGNGNYSIRNADHFAEIPVTPFEITSTLTPIPVWTASMTVSDSSVLPITTQTPSNNLPKGLTNEKIPAATLICLSILAIVLLGAGFTMIAVGYTKYQ